MVVIRRIEGRFPGGFDFYMTVQQPLEVVCGAYGSSFLSSLRFTLVLHNPTANFITDRSPFRRYHEVFRFLIRVIDKSAIASQLRAVYNLVKSSLTLEQLPKLGPDFAPNLRVA